LILGSDTTVVLGNKIIGKPHSLDHAQKLLSTLSGKSQKVCSAICVFDTYTQTCWLRSEETRVTFAHLTPKEIKHYVTHYSPLDKAGGYGIQEVPDSFISSIEGCYYNVMGLPIKSLLKLLTDYDIV